MTYGSTVKVGITAMKDFNDPKASSEEKQKIGFLGDALIRSEMFASLSLKDKIRLRVATAKMHDMSPMSTAIAIQEAVRSIFGLHALGMDVEKKIFKYFLELIYEKHTTIPDNQTKLQLAMQAYLGYMGPVFGKTSKEGIFLTALSEALKLKKAEDLKEAVIKALVSEAEAQKGTKEEVQKYQTDLNSRKVSVDLVKDIFMDRAKKAEDGAGILDGFFELIEKNFPGSEEATGSQTI